MRFSLHQADLTQFFIQLADSLTQQKQSSVNFISHDSKQERMSDNNQIKTAAQALADMLYSHFSSSLNRQLK
jgi:hypothetical protein